MNQKIEREIKRYILPKLFHAIKFKNKKITFLSGDDNLILSVRRKNKNVIIRVTPESYKTYDETLSELDIIEYLITKEVPISKPLVLIEDKKTLRFNYKDRYYTVSLFEKAKGKEINPGEREPNVFDKSRHGKNVEEIFLKFGKYTAIMHNALSVYIPSIKNFTRPDLNQHLQRVYDVIDEDKIVFSIYKSCLERINLLSRTKSNYGLVHFDLHSSNFFVYKNDLTFFDFTDTQYSFYMWDVAKIFFSSVPFNLHSEKDLMLFKRKYESFLKGYRRYRKLTKKDEELIKMFLNVTELRMYLALKQRYRKKIDKKDLWSRGFLNGRKENLEKGYTVFEAMKKYLGS
ncbi:MAG: phosphotransferase [Ignavibacteria bacterium]|nr:phosphotransferase [Ignavibacteria bacterium]